MSSGDDVHTIDISYSCVSNHSVASLNVSLDSQGSAQLLRAIFITKTKCFRFYEKKIWTEKYENCGPSVYSG